MQYAYYGLQYTILYTPKLHISYYTITKIAKVSCISLPFFVFYNVVVFVNCKKTVKWFDTTFYCMPHKIHLCHCSYGHIATLGRLHANENTPLQLSHKRVSECPLFRHIVTDSPAAFEFKERWCCPNVLCTRRLLVRIIDLDKGVPLYHHNDS